MKNQQPTSEPSGSEEKKSKKKEKIKDKQKLQKQVYELTEEKQIVQISDDEEDSVANKSNLAQKAQANRVDEKQKVSKQKNSPKQMASNSDTNNDEEANDNEKIPKKKKSNKVKLQEQKEEQKKQQSEEQESEEQLPQKKQKTKKNSLELQKAQKSKKSDKQDKDTENDIEKMFDDNNEKSEEKDENSKNNRRHVHFDTQVDEDELKKDKQKSDIFKEKLKSNKKKTKDKEQLNVTMKKLETDSQQSNKRKWSEKDKEFIKGKFTDEEVETLKRGVCEYALEQNFSANDLTQLITEKSTSENKNAWIKIAECLPNRTVQSCHNLIKRHFNPQNYQGTWSEQEKNELIDLVEQHGRKWDKISKILGRTPTNVRDKFKNIGEEKHEQRVKQWNLAELILLLKHIQKKVGVKFIQNELQEVIDKNPDLLERVSQKTEKSDKKSSVISQDVNLQFLSDYINYDIARKIDFKNINWTKIANKIGTKSKDDCKNKFYQQIYNTIFYKQEFTLKEDKFLVEQIQLQAPEKEEDIDFSKIENEKTADQNKQRWVNLKKLVSARQSINVEQILNELEQYLSHCKKEYVNRKQRNYTSIKKQSSLISSASNDLLNLYQTQYLQAEKQQEEEQNQ